VIRRAHDRVRGLTFSQLQPIAEGIGPASLQYSPPPLPSPPPERTEGGKGRKGKGRGKWVHGSDCSASRHPSTIHRRISLRNARPERTSGLSRIARCRALFSPVTEVAKLPGLPSPPPPFPMGTPMAGRFVSPGDHNSHGISGGSSAATRRANLLSDL